MTYSNAALATLNRKALNLLQQLLQEARYSDAELQAQRAYCQSIGSHHAEFFSVALEARAQRDFSAQDILEIKGIFAR